MVDKEARFVLIYGMTKKEYQEKEFNFYMDNVGSLAQGGTATDIKVIEALYKHMEDNLNKVGIKIGE